MRLTLRTLLSYLDNVLDEPSRAELRRQIEASEHASEWVHRTRDVTRRLKLGAPEPAGTGSIDDPNTVAEYLDRTLPEEGVAEFERVCLESDVMLAEVASCHHVLAMFLSEPTEIDPDTRQRLYRLQADLEAALKQPAAPVAAPVAAATLAAADGSAAERAPARRVRAVSRPAETEEEQGGFWSDLAPWAPAIAALLLLSATAFLVLNNDTSSEVAKGGASNQAKDVTPAPVDPVTLSPVTPSEDPGPAVPGQPNPPGTIEGVGAGPLPSETGVTGPNGVNPAGAGTPAGMPAGAAGEGTAATATVEPAPQPSVTAPSITPPTETVLTDTAPADPAPSGPADSAMTGLPLTDPSPAAVPPPLPTPPAGSEPSEPATEQPEATAEGAQPKPMLTYYGDPTVSPASPMDPNGFVVVEAAGGVWSRLLNSMFMEAPQKGHVVSLPSYRGAFELSQGVLVELVDQTEAVIDPEQPSVELLYGRVVVSSFPDADEPVELAVRIDAVDYTLTLKPGAQVAIAADRFYDAGRPMLEDPAPMVAIAHALAGDSVWKTPNSERSSAMPAPLFFVSGRLTGAPDGFRDPAWVTDVAVSDADRESAPYVASQIREGSAVAQLMALANAKNSNETRDVVSLASRCCAAMKQLDALVASFEDKAQADEWGRHLDTLRQTASRSVAGAEAVRKALVDKYDEAGGGALFAVVQGFTADQVGGDAAAVQAGVIPTTLLPMVESEDLATRVLGTTALFELIEHRASAKDLAAGDRTERRRFVRRLERDLQQGELALVPR